MDIKKTGHKIITTNFLLVVGIFFFWGFVAASNSVLIGFCKSVFTLSQLESQFLDTAFYGAYFYGSVAVYAYTHYRKKDFIASVGYRKGLLIGLAISCVGVLFLYLVSARTDTGFAWLLTGFFITGVGFSIQQLIANPLVISLGTPATGHFRLSFAGGINSMGTLIGPILLSRLIFVAPSIKGNIASIQHVYLTLLIIFLILLVVVRFLRLPARVEEKNASDKIREKSISFLLLILSLVVPFVLLPDFFDRFLHIPKLFFLCLLLFIMLVSIIGAHLYARRQEGDFFARAQLPWGMLAIFIYVGVEVAIPGNFNVLFASEKQAFTPLDVAHYIALYWGSLMIGRTTIAMNIFHYTHTWQRYVIYFVSASAAFLFILLLQSWGSDGWKVSAPYFIFVLLFATLMRYAGESSRRLLQLVSLLAMLLLVIGIGYTGAGAHFFFIATGLCCAVVWPCVFSIAIADMGADSGRASSLLIMMILGGAIIPPLQGAICDMGNRLVGITLARFSYFVPLLGFAYLFFYARFLSRKK